MCPDVSKYPHTRNVLHIDVVDMNRNTRVRTVHITNPFNSTHISNSKYFILSVSYSYTCAFVSQIKHARMFNTITGNNIPKADANKHRTVFKVINSWVCYVCEFAKKCEFIQKKQNEKCEKKRRERRFGKCKQWFVNFMRLECSCCYYLAGTWRGHVNEYNLVDERSAVPFN